MSAGREHRGLLSVVRDALGYMPAQWIPALASLVAVSIYTRYLDAESYGYLLLATSTVSICVAVGFGWLSNATLRDYEAHRTAGSLDVFGSTALTLLLAAVVVVGAGWALVVGFVIAPRATQLGAILAIGVWLMIARALYSFAIAALRAMRRVRAYALLASATAVVGVGLSVAFLILLRQGASGVIAATAISFGLMSAAALVGIARSWRPRFGSFRLDVAKSFARYGVPLVGLSFGGMILSFADRYMLLLLVGASTVGVYGAGYALANRVVIMLSSALSGASFPVLIRAYEREGEEKAAALLGQIGATFLGLMLPAVVGFSLLATDIVRLLGGSYRGSSDYLPWIASGVFCLGLAQIAGKPLELRKRTMPLLFMILGAALLNIVLNLLLIPPLGARGAAYATLAAYAVYSVLVYVVGQRELRWKPPLSTVWRVAVATACMAVVVILLRPIPGLGGFVLCVAGGGGAYLALLLGLREPLLLNIVKRLRAGRKRPTADS